jgi:hypothetical protein
MLPSQRALFDIPRVNDEEDADRFLALLRGLAGPWTGARTGQRLTRPRRYACGSAGA